MPDARPAGGAGGRGGDRPPAASSSCCETLVDSGREVGVSSLRADRLTQELVDTLRRGRGAACSPWPRTGRRQRMRDLVDRKHSEEQIVRAARFAQDGGDEAAQGLQRWSGCRWRATPTSTSWCASPRELSAHPAGGAGRGAVRGQAATPRSTGRRSRGIREIDGRLERLRRGLQGKAEVRPTSARWAWVEYMLAQCGPEAGLAAMDAWRAGGSFAAWKRAFAARGCTPTLRAGCRTDGAFRPSGHGWTGVRSAAPAA